METGHSGATQLPLPFATEEPQTAVNCALQIMLVFQVTTALDLNVQNFF